MFHITKNFKFFLTYSFRKILRKFETEITKKRLYFIFKTICQYDDNQSTADGSAANSRNVVHIKYIQKMGNVQHNIGTSNEVLSQTFKESLKIQFKIPFGHSFKILTVLLYQ
jgi:hypothetical protein